MKIYSRCIDKWLCAFDKRSATYEQKILEMVTDLDCEDLEFIFDFTEALKDYTVQNNDGWYLRCNKNDFEELVEQYVKRYENFKESQLYRLIQSVLADWDKEKMYVDDYKNSNMLTQYIGILYSCSSHIEERK